MNGRIVVVGGGYAGLAALHRIRTLDRDVELVLVEPREAFEERVRLHEALAWGTRPVRPYGPICAALRVEHVQARVTRVDGSTLWLGDRALPFDACVVALGSRGRALPGAVGIDDVAQAHQLRDRLQGRVTVVGGGLTGLELVTELAVARPDLRLSLAVQGPRQGFSARVGAAIDARLERLGIAVVERTDDPVQIAAVGFRAVMLPGLTADADGRVPVDADLRALPRVFVAGDLARPPLDPGTGCVSAMPMGAVAGANAVALLRDRPLTPFAMDRPVVCVSLGRGSAVVQGLSGGEPTWGLSGRPAAWVKAAILRGTTDVMTLERWTGLTVYRWPGSSPARPLLEAT